MLAFIAGNKNSSILPEHVFSQTNTWRNHRQPVGMKAAISFGVGY
jgi:hypothetical protein